MKLISVVALLFTLSPGLFAHERERPQTRFVSPGAAASEAIRKAQAEAAEEARRQRQEAREEELQRALIEQMRAEQRYRERLLAEQNYRERPAITPPADPAPVAGTFDTEEASSPSGTTPHTQPSQVDSLKGLTGVAVIVAALSEDAERDGLTRAEIQTDVEIKMRLAGIRVLTSEEAREAPGSPYVYINVDVMRNASLPFYAYSIRVELFQLVESVVRPGVVLQGIAWQGTRIGMVGADNLRSVRDEVKDDVDRFINDWLTANPIDLAAVTNGVVPAGQLDSEPAEVRERNRGTEILTGAFNTFDRTSGLLTVVHADGTVVTVLCPPQTRLLAEGGRPSLGDYLQSHFQNHAWSFRERLSITATVGPDGNLTASSIR